VGKLAGIGVIAIVALAYMSRSVTQDKVFSIAWLCVGVLIIVVFSIVLVAILRPDLAVMEGMEIVQYKRATAAAKGFNPDRELPPIPDPGLPPLLTTASEDNP